MVRLYNHSMSDLTQLMNAFMERMTTISGVTEGRVLTVGPPPYRRLDCDGRALAYVRVRRRQGIVRIDVSSLWNAERASSRLRIPTASGAATLALKSDVDLDDAFEFFYYLICYTGAERKDGRT